MPTQPEILFEDPHLLVLNKPSGWLTEGGGRRETDLEQWGSKHAGRPVWSCHRLDRPTSGVVVLRKTAQFTKQLADIFEGRQVRKTYWALVVGDWPRGRQKVETRIAPVAGQRGVFANVENGGKPATTTIRVLGRTRSPVGNRSWLSLLLKTGRTHQARLHCLAGGCPVVGDPLYGEAADDGFFGLHARELRLPHPATGESMTFTAPPPENWETELERFSR